MDTNQIAAVILAAGYSRRMGRFKPLLKIGDRTIIERAVALFQDAQIQDVRVVVGHARELIEPVLEKARARVIVNENYDRGMFSSVLAALESLEPSIRAVFILPADVPLVSPLTIECLLKRHQREPEKILVPGFQGKRGHPVVIPARYFHAIKDWRGENGLRGALGRLGDETIAVPVDDPNVLFDVDTPEDYRELEKRWSEAVK